MKSSLKVVYSTDICAGETVNVLTVKKYSDGSIYEFTGDDARWLYDILTGHLADFSNEAVVAVPKGNDEYILKFAKDCSGEESYSLLDKTSLQICNAIRSSYPTA